jgi:hypothetical protein
MALPPVVPVDGKTSPLQGELQERFTRRGHSSIGLWLLGCTLFS